MHKKVTRTVTGGALATLFPGLLHLLRAPSLFRVLRLGFYTFIHRRCLL